MTTTPIPQADLTALFEILDAHPLKIGGDEPLEAHLVTMEGEEGEVVEFRTEKDVPKMWMHPDDYAELVGLGALNGKQ